MKYWSDFWAYFSLMSSSGSRKSHSSLLPSVFQNTQRFALVLPFLFTLLFSTPSLARQTPLSTNHSLRFQAEIDLAVPVTGPHQKDDYMPVGMSLSARLELLNLKYALLLGTVFRTFPDFLDKDPRYKARNSWELVTVGFRWRPFLIDKNNCLPRRMFFFDLNLGLGLTPISNEAKPIISLLAGVGYEWQVNKGVIIGLFVRVLIQLQSEFRWEPREAADLLAITAGLSFTFGFPNKFDHDKDKTCDPYDNCPRKAGPKKNHGCPWGDADCDGIEDNVDNCPNEPEDQDGFKDTDGCPDPDNDGDKICDDNPQIQKNIGKWVKQGKCKGKDECQGRDIDGKTGFVRTIEDKDGFQDDDGCPDPDNDNDLICDNNKTIQSKLKYWEGKRKCRPKLIDYCPERPETYNGHLDKDGCPDSIPLGKVHFAHNSAILTFSDKTLLKYYAKAMNNTKIHYCIQAHTDKSGPALNNMRLSEKRAKTVRRYLIRKGVKPHRLIDKGCGEDFPLEANCPKKGSRAEAKQCMAKNRRVEFIPIKPGTKVCYCGPSTKPKARKATPTIKVKAGSKSGGN